LPRSTNRAIIQTIVVTFAVIRFDRHYHKDGATA
jgi:hypothetical protein